MNSKEIEEQIEKLKKNLTKAFNQNKGKDDWSILWKEHIEKTLISTNSRIERLSKGEMPVFDETLEGRPFWVKIMETVKESLWTTNIASRNTFGSDLESLIAIQRQAIDRKVLIERVFVFDKKDKHLIPNLITVITNQLFNGIKVSFIEENVFQNVTTSLQFQPNTDDFMIIDDKFCYETNFNPDVNAFRNVLSKDEEFVQNMIKIKRLVNKSSTRVTLDNISEFPEIV